MEIGKATVLFAVGIVLIVKGSDAFVDASCWISDVTGISRAVIGATLVSFATTSPEYFVSLTAVLRGYNDLSVGNAVGSLSCNIGIAFGFLALCVPGTVTDKLFSLKGFIMTGAAVLLLMFCLNGIVSVPEGLLLILVYVAFTVINIRNSKDGVTKSTRTKALPRDITVNVLKFVLGAAAVVVSSNLIVDSGKTIAAFLGVSDAVIGLTVVAIGTSLPEIVTSIAAVAKKQHSLSIGNILGANILDTTLILATGAFVSRSGLTVSAATAFQDLPMAILLMLLTVIPVMIWKKTFRLQGGVIVAVYVAYVVTITLL